MSTKDNQRADINIEANDLSIQVKTNCPKREQINYTEQEQIDEMKITLDLKFVGLYIIRIYACLKCCLVNRIKVAFL
jgi:hypothetical protein